MESLSQSNTDRLRANLERVRERIEAAVDRSGRRDAPRLCAVTKAAPESFIPALMDLGVEAIGESRPEQIVRRSDELDRRVPWHMIGHLQRKKIPKVLSLLDMVHSGHSLELLGHLDMRARETNLSVPLLIQVNVSKEAAKQGFSPGEVGDVVDIADHMPGIDVRGLMTMAPNSSDESSLRRIFGELFKLREAIGTNRLPELSMGMSDDFEAAVMEGSTIIRVGRALFEGIDL